MTAVRADTLGYTGFDWGSGSYDISDNMRSSVYLLPQEAVPESLFVFLITDQDARVRCAIYDYADSSFIDSTNIRSLAASEDDRYFGFAFQHSAVIPAGTRLMLCAVSDAGTRLRRHDSVGVTRTYSGGTYDDMWPDRLAAWIEVADMTYGMYITYSPSGMPLTPRWRRRRSATSGAVDHGQ
jgi:hypothetical protein